MDRGRHFPAPNPAGSGAPFERGTQRLRIDGKVRHLGLGAYPKVSLREARKRALANAQDVAEGRDPRKIKAVPTFEEAAEAVIELHRPTYKHPRTADQWAGSLRDYVYPKIGKKSVAEISTADVLSCLAPSWNERRNTLVKVRQRISTVLKWSIAQGHRTDDPMIGVGSALPRGGAPKTHLDERPPNPVHICLQFIMATRHFAKVSSLTPP